MLPPQVPGEPGEPVESFGDYVPDADDFDLADEDVVRPERGAPEDPTLTLLRKIEQNTAITRAWARFFGFVWLLSFLVYLVVLSSWPGARR